MHKTILQTSEFFRGFLPLVSGVQGAQIVICAPFVNLSAAVEAAMGSPVGIGAQDVFWLKEGAYTGEVSAPMLAAAGCEWVIVGHSERRQYFGETDETVLKKTTAALDAGLTPIVCVGESLAEREAGATESVLARQFAAGIAPLKAAEFARIVIAYEPVWAIGTGKTATPEIAGSAHAFLRSQVAGAFGGAASDSCRILYGGSVKPENIASVMAQPDVDGALVGGASLDPATFAAIVKF